MYTSHFHRTSCKVFGPRKHVRKVHFVDANPFEEDYSKESADKSKASDILLPSYYTKWKAVPEKQEVISETLVHAKARDHKSWVEERKKLRSDLDQLGLNASWLKRKPDRTPLEECVLSRLLNEPVQDKCVVVSLPKLQQIKLVVILCIIFVEAINTL